MGIDATLKAVGEFTDESCWLEVREDPHHGYFDE